MPKIIIGVGGIITDGNGKFLLTQRGEEGNPLADFKWQIPGGGMEYGETPEATLIRELKEEIDVVPTVLRPHPIAKTTTWEDHQAHIMILCYLVSIGSQKPSKANQETYDYGWFSMQEIIKLDCLPNTLEFLQEAQQILLS